MAGEWRETTLDQLGRIVTGKTPPSGRAEYFSGDIPFVTPTDFDGRRVIDSTGRYLTEEGASVVSGSRIPAHAVMVSCIGSDMGKAAMAGRDCVTNQQINSIVVESGDDPLFVYYNLSTRKAEIRTAASGSAQPILNKSAFGQLDILLPPPDEQRAIAKILGTLDDKIELNRRMNETLEAVARALFRAWFVDFDPVRLKIKGRDPGLPKPLADLFPDSFDESELGDIPRGWEVRGLDDIARFLNGLALQKFPPKDGRSLPVIKIAQLRARNTDGADKASADLEADYIVEDGDVLFSWSGSLECVLWPGGRGALNQHLFKVTSPQFPKWLYYLWISQHLPDFRHIAAAKATTMGHIQRHHLSEAKVVLPQPALLDAADRRIGPLVDAIVKIRIESRTLASVRDVLLPKLISGEIRVENADRIVGVDQ